MNYFVLLAIILIPSIIVSQRFKRKIKKYSKIPLTSGLSGAEVAQRMLQENGIYDVKISLANGVLSDHYNPANKTVNLSKDVYYGRSIASASIAAHECGHAVQHARSYSMLKLRSALVPIQNMSSRIINGMMLVALFGGMLLFKTFPINIFLIVMIASYAMITLFAFVTLPVEFDASKRATLWLEASNITRSNELVQVKDGLRWAAMTYVIAALSSLASLLYYVSIFMRRN